MALVRFVSSDKTTLDVEAMPGMSVMEAALMAGVPEILGICGGICSCATCHVMVHEQWITRTGTPSEEERAMLDSLDITAPESRLGCQIKLTDALSGLVVHVPKESK